MNIENYVNPEMLGIAGASAAIGALAMRAFMKGPLHDEGHRVYVTPNFEALQTVLDVCEENNLRPSREIADEKVIQALMEDNKTVFLVTRPDVWQEMGEPTAAPTLRVKNPFKAAERAHELFLEKGFASEILAPLSDQTKGDLLFVRTDALSCGLIGFRQHVVKMGPKPPKWKHRKARAFSKSLN